jgi:hypothetical protein
MPSTVSVFWSEETTAAVITGFQLYSRSSAATVGAEIATTSATTAAVLVSVGVMPASVADWMPGLIHI